ncbi:MAG: hypothetical protein ACREVV_11130 [Steroidobacteraceae bacterium]
MGTRLAVPAAALLMCAPLWVAAAEGSSAGEEAQSGIWKQKELTFVYQGFTAKYSCDGLRDEVRRALLQLGADKKDLQVRETGCTSGFGRPDPFPGVRVKMNVLEPAAGGTDDKQPSVQAHWKPVDLKLRDTYVTDSGECELVDEIRRKILPLFATRNVSYRTDCIPHQASAVGPSLKLEVLMADRKDQKVADGKDQKVDSPR